MSDSLDQATGDRDREQRVDGNTFQGVNSIALGYFFNEWDTGNDIGGTGKCEIIVRSSREMESATECSPRSQFGTWMYQRECPSKQDVLDAIAVGKLIQRESIKALRKANP